MLCYRLGTKGNISIYFKFSSEMLSRTSSQMCGRWYFPIFLLRDGLFTLMYRASFMVLKRFWFSLPSMEKLSIVTSWPEMLRWSYMGDGALRCSLYLSSKSLADSPVYLHHNPPCHTYICIWPHFSWGVDLCLGGHKKVFDGMTSFEMF